MNADGLSTEAERLRALERYAIAGTPPEPTFDEIAALAARLCGMPQAFITFVEAERCSFKAAIGAESGNELATASICTLLVSTRTPMLVPDTTLDPRTRDRAAVTQGGVRFYAGVPLWTSDGHVLGALCVTDTRSRELAPEHLETLAVLGRQVVAQLESRAQTEALRAADWLARTALEIGSGAAWVVDVARGTVAGDSLLAQWFAVPPERCRTGEPIASFVAAIHPDDRALVQDALGRSFENGQPYDVEFRAFGTDEVMRWFHSRGRPKRNATGAVESMPGMILDITGRRGAEEAERESAARLRLATEAAQLGIFVWHMAEDRVEWENEQVYRQLGRTLDDGPINAAEFAEKIIHPEDRTAFESAVAAAVASDAPFFLQCRFFRKDGALRWIEFHGRITRAADDTPLWMLGTTADITQRKQAEEVLRESEARFRQIADVAPAMTWITDPQGQCTFLSRSWYEFTGTPEGSGLGLAWVETVHPDDRATAAEIFLAANERRESFALDYRVRRADGEYRWALDTARPRFGPGGEYLGFIGNVFDLHERKAAEAALRESNERFRELFESIDEGFCVVEMEFGPGGEALDYRILQANPAFERLTGLAGALGRSVREMAPALEEYWYEIYGRVARWGKPERFVNPAEPMGRVFDVFAFPTGGAGSRQVGILFTDVTERKRVEAALRDAKDQAESASRAKDNFLAALSHELRTPLTPVLMSAAALREDESLPTNVRETLAMIERNVTVEARLIDDLLDLTRIAKGKLTMRAAPCDAHSLIGLAAEVVRDEAREKQIVFEFDLAASRSHLIGDPAFGGRLETQLGLSLQRP